LLYLLAWAWCWSPWILVSDLVGNIVPNFVLDSEITNMFCSSCKMLGSNTFTNYPPPHLAALHAEHLIAKHLKDLIANIQEIDGNSINDLRIGLAIVAIAVVY